MQRAHLHQDSDAGQVRAAQPETVLHACAGNLELSPRHARAKALGALVDASPRVVAQRRQAAQLFGDAAAPARANRTGLPDPLKAGIEALSGVSLDDVRVHYGSASPAQLGAHAYAQGQDIHLASGQERHLPHEAWHVVQQAQGRVAPTLRMANGTPLNDDAALEREADVMGARALQRMIDPALANNAVLPPVRAGSTSGTAVQRVGEEWIGPIAQTLGITLSAAGQFVFYLLRTYPVTAIVGLLGSAALAAAYRRFTRTDEEVAATEVEPDSGSASEQDAESVSGDQSEAESEPVPDFESESEPASASGSESEVIESTSDFKWVGKSAVRAKGKLSPYRQTAWDEFIRLGPPKKGKKKAAKPKKKNMNDEIFKSKQQAKARDAALAPASAPYRPYRAVPIAGSTPFFVNIEKRAEGTKSSSLAGKAGTKPLAVVYGHHGGASYDASGKAEVHVHFNDDDPIDSHTGAHVKIGGAYVHSWASGNASAQADLASILQEGFHGDGWTKNSKYL